MVTNINHGITIQIFQFLKKENEMLGTEIDDMKKENFSRLISYAYAKSPFIVSSITVCCILPPTYSY